MHVSTGLWSYPHKSGHPDAAIKDFLYSLGISLYLLATAAAIVSPFYTIGICTAMWVFWAFTIKREDYQRKGNSSIVRLNCKPRANNQIFRGEKSDRRDRSYTKM